MPTYHGSAAMQGKAQYIKYTEHYVYRIGAINLKEGKAKWQKN
jgi:hypothetical protein